MNVPRCSFKSCERVAVCGLRYRADGVTINVCGTHYETVKCEPYVGWPRWAPIQLELEVKR